MMLGGSGLISKQWKRKRKRVNFKIVEAEAEAASFKKLKLKHAEAEAVKNSPLSHHCTQLPLTYVGEEASENQASR